MRAVTLSVYLFLGALTLSPLLWASVPGLIDYPNHLARMWILAHANEAGPNYVVHWKLIPNLAMELTVPMLAWLLPIEWAGRLFIAVAMMLPVLGTVTLRRALCGRVGLWPLAAFLFVYNAVLYWGFLSYLFGLGVALLAFSLWVASGRWRAVRRLSLFSAVTMLLFVLHLFAFGVYGLLVASYEAGRRLSARGWSLGGIAPEALFLTQFLPSALLWFAIRSSGGPMYLAYGTWADKIYAVGAPMSFGLVGWTAAVCCTFLGWVAWKLGVLTLSASMRLPILAIIVAAVLMPNWIMGSWRADIRLPVALPFIFIASTQPRLVARRIAVTFPAIAAILLGAHVWAISISWRALDGLYAEFRHSASSLPRGARLLVVWSAIPPDKEIIDGVPPILTRRRAADFMHMPALAIIDRDAFIPYLFTGWTTVVPGPRNTGRFQSSGLPISPKLLIDAALPRANPAAAQPNILGEMPYWVNWPEKFEFVLWIDFGVLPPYLPGQLKPWAEGSFFHIYRVSGR